MARNNKRDKRRLNRQLALAQPFELNFNEDDERDFNSEDDSDYNARERQIGAPELRSKSTRTPALPSLALDSLDSSTKSVPQRINTLIEPQDRDIANSLYTPLDSREKPKRVPLEIRGDGGMRSNLKPAGVTPNNISLQTQFTPVSPLLSGNVDPEVLTRSLLFEQPEATGNNLIAPLPASPRRSSEELASLTTFPSGARTPGTFPTDNREERELSPEERLLQAMSNTNPTPRSWWKRALTGLARGASMVQPGDDFGTAFGRIVGGVVAQSVPGVDRRFQYEQNKAKAIERYKVEAESREQKQKQQKLDTELANANAQLAEARQRRIDAANARVDAAKEKLADNKRQEADQLLRTLKDLPDDDAQRLVIAKRLRDDYNIPTSAKYGIDPAKSSNATKTIYDEETDTYILSDARGNPILRDGKPVTVRPGAAAKPVTLKDAQEQANSELIQSQGTVKQIAESMIDKDGIRRGLPQRYQDALNNPQGASGLVYKAAQEEYQKQVNAEQARQEKIVESTRQRDIQTRAREIMGETAPTRTPRGERKTVSPRPSGGAAKVQASERNAIGKRDFRKPRKVMLPR